jgi:hypothetical protein
MNQAYDGETSASAFERRARRDSNRDLRSPSGLCRPASPGAISLIRRDHEFSGTGRAIASAGRGLIGGLHFLSSGAVNRRSGARRAGRGRVGRGTGIGAVVPVVALLAVLVGCGASGHVLNASSGSEWSALSPFARVALFSRGRGLRLARVVAVARVGSGWRTLLLSGSALMVPAAGWASFRLRVLARAAPAPSTAWSRRLAAASSCLAGFPSERWFVR